MSKIIRKKYDHSLPYDVLLACIAIVIETKNIKDFIFLYQISLIYLQVDS